MSSSRFVSCLAAALFATACGSGDGPPNVVLILVDALRADKLSCYGFPETTSPEIDAWASRGVRFERVLAQSSWTRPSMASMLTSQPPRALGIYDERRDALSPRFATLAEVLRRNGYATLGATANPNVNSAFGFDRGFDRHIDSNVVWAWMPRSGEQRVARDFPIETADEIFARVLSVLEDDGRPTYVQVNVMDVHQAFKDPRRVAELAERFPDAPERPYLEAIRETSRAVDAFVGALLERPGFENTLVVVTSDHGEGLWDHPDVPNSRGHGLYLYESQLWVPLVFYDTSGRLPAGRVVSRTVRLLDLMPTLLDWAGVPGAPEMQGVSLLPLLLGTGDVSLPDSFFVETQFRRARKVGVYTDRWKYIENRELRRRGIPRELQAIGTPENGARTDAAERHPDVVRRLGGLLASWERENPRAQATPLDGELSPSEREQLRALGYLPDGTPGSTSSGPR